MNTVPAYPTAAGIWALYRSTSPRARLWWSRQEDEAWAYATMVAPPPAPPSPSREEDSQSEVLLHDSAPISGWPLAAGSSTDPQLPSAAYSASGSPRTLDEDPADVDAWHRLAFDGLPSAELWESLASEDSVCSPCAPSTPRVPVPQTYPRRSARVWRNCCSVHRCERLDEHLDYDPRGREWGIRCIPGSECNAGFQAWCMLHAKGRSMRHLEIVPRNLRHEEETHCRLRNHCLRLALWWTDFAWLARVNPGLRSEDYDLDRQ